MSRNESGHAPHRRTSVLWAGGGVAAAVLVLAVNGTLSSWTSAIITNDHNTAASAAAVRLVESSGLKTCDTGDSPTNTVTCSQIDKYGGTDTPMSPGDTQTVEVDLANQGTGSGELALAPGTCSATDGSGSPATHDACGQFLVSVSCDNGFQAGPAPLSSFADGDIGTLDAGDSAACTFEVSLPDGTPSEYASETVSQPLTWTLTAAGA